MPYITRPFASPINDASVARKQYDDAGSTVTALATVFSPQVTLNVADAVAIKAINADRHIFPKPLELLQMLTPYGQNVLVTGGDEWKKHRKVVAPAFTENTYALGWKVSLSITNDWIADLDKRLGQTDHTKVKASVIEKDFPKLSLQLALSIFTTTAFGYRIASPGQVADPVPPGHTYNLKDTLEGALDLLNLFYAFFIPDWLRKIAFGRVQKALNLKQELNLWLAEIIQQRNFELNDGGERKDLLSNLVKANEDASKEDVSAVNGRNSSSQSLSLRELNGNAFIFLLAGHETSRFTSHMSLIKWPTHQPCRPQLRLFWLVAISYSCTHSSFCFGTSGILSR